MSRVQRGKVNAFGNAFSSLAPVSQVKEFAYTVNITIGAETLEHIVDTGSSDLASDDRLILPLPPHFHCH
ncbi:hypothetical protein PTI98_002624 [Pleurotus ostreatus]|nr:hypothetical protein PTI98_002624 [Pleurotus ostreatus]